MIEFNHAIYIYRYTFARFVSFLVYSYVKQLKEKEILLVLFQFFCVRLSKMSQSNQWVFFVCTRVFQKYLFKWLSRYDPLIDSIQKGSSKERTVRMKRHKVEEMMFEENSEDALFSCGINFTDVIDLISFHESGRIEALSIKLKRRPL